MAGPRDFMQVDGLEIEDTPKGSQSRVLQRRETNHTIRSTVVTVNMFCVIGAAIGLSAVFLPWLWTSVEGLQVDSTYAEYLCSSNPSSGNERGLFLGGILFIVGSGLAFAIPAGCFVQGLGLLWFLTAELNREARISESSYSGMIDGGIAYGWYVGVLSLMLVVVGITMTYDAAVPKEDGRKGGRIYTFAKVTKKKGGNASVSFASSSEMVAAFKQRKIWTGVLATLFLVSGTLVIADSPPVSYDNPVKESQEGVQLRLMDVGLVMLSARWDDFTVTIQEGSESVNWTQLSVTDSSFGGTGEVLYTFDSRNLSGLWLRLELLDFGGEGQWSAGDVVTIALDGDSQKFKEETVYAITLLPPFLRALDVSFVHVDVEFSYVNGLLQSEGAVIASEGYVPPDINHGPQIALLLLVTTAAMAAFLSLILRAICRHRALER
jgi:hypothetical protein